MTIVDYKLMLDRMYEEAKVMDCVAPESKLEYIAKHIFDFTTYDGNLDVYFSGKMLEVVKAIVTGTTFEYQKQSDEHYLNYITMCNMPFLTDKLDWGTSIRGAWFNHGPCKIDCDNEEVEDLTEFCLALISWCE